MISRILAVSAITEFAKSQGKKPALKHLTGNPQGSALGELTVMIAKSSIQLIRCMFDPFALERLGQIADFAAVTLIAGAAVFSTCTFYPTLLASKVTVVALFAFLGIRWGNRFFVQLTHLQRLEVSSKVLSSANRRLSSDLRKTSSLNDSYRTANSENHATLVGLQSTLATLTRVLVANQSALSKLQSAMPSQTRDPQLPLKIQHGPCPRVRRKPQHHNMVACLRMLQLCNSATAKEPKHIGKLSPSTYRGRTALFVNGSGQVASAAQAFLFAQILFGKSRFFPRCLKNRALLIAVAGGLWIHSLRQNIKGAFSQSVKELHATASDFNERVDQYQALQKKHVLLLKQTAQLAMILRILNGFLHQNTLKTAETTHALRKIASQATEVQFT